MRDESEVQDAPASKLKPANENPWYVLMTLYGEQDGDKVDEDRHGDNTRIWNTYFSGSGTREEIFRSKGLVFSKIARKLPKPEVESLFATQWKKRNGDDLPVPKLPNAQADIDLTGHQFEKDLVLSGMVFAKKLKLEGGDFSKSVLVRDCGFEAEVSLGKSTIGGCLDFTNSCFLQQLSAKGITITGDLRLEGTTFEGDLTFDRGEVHAHAFLAGMNVEAAAALNLRVHGEADFENCKFADTTVFDFAIFQGSARFTQAKFGGKTSFVWVSFGADLSFASSVFEQNVVFRKTSILNRANFTNVQFKGITDFAESEFHTSGTKGVAGIRFTDAIFSKPTSFRGATFKHSYPELTNTDLYPVTDFSADALHWPEGLTVPAKEARESCGIIRNLLSKKGLTEDQHFFFRREMFFASHQEEWLSRIPYQIYEWLSDYGHSIKRPILWLLGIWILGLAALCCYFSGYQYLCFSYINMALPCFSLEPAPKENLDGWTAAGLSFSNLFPLFGLGRLHFKEVLEGLPPFLKFVAGFQTVASLPLLFFLGLGLRQRFRLR